MRTISIIASAMLLTTGVVRGDAAGESSFLASRHVVLNYQTTGETAVRDLRVWVSTDCGRDWTLALTELRQGTTVHFDAPSDGRFDFYLVLVNEHGPSGPPPLPGTAPHVSVIVDTRPPMLQLHQAQIRANPNGGREIALNLSLIEEHLGERGLRLFYRATTDTVWQDGGIATLVDGRVTWPVADGLPDVLDVRLAATDLAGNRTTEDWSDVAAPIVQVAPAGERTTDGPAPKLETELDPARAAEPPVDPIAAMARLRRVAELREKARSCGALGRYRQAVELLGEARELTPNDPELLVELGGALLRASETDRAKECFSQAVEAAPDQGDALSGLALIAAKDHNYPQAREHLLKLVRLAPDDPQNLLRYGDIELRLGNTDAARKAWRGVLTNVGEDDPYHRRATSRLTNILPLHTPSTAMAAGSTHALR